MSSQSQAPARRGKPLAGLFVVAIEQAAAAPYVSSRLADAGARVVKIEKAGGDMARHYDKAVMGQSSYFVWLNRGKESVLLDYTQPVDAALLQQLIARADVLIQNLGPGVAKRAGFGSEDMRKLNPRLITCDISGYGEDGPYADMRAYDLLVQAESGICSITGTPDAPGRIGVSACDVGTGMYAHAAILEALLERERFGEGTAIRVSMFDSMSDWMSVPLLHHDYAGTIWPRVGLTHPTIAPYGVFPAGGRTDEAGQLLIGVTNDEEWQRLARHVFERDELADREVYRTNNSRVSHRVELERELHELLADMSMSALRDKLRRAKVAFARVNDVSDLSQHPHLRRITVATPQGDAHIVAPPTRFDSGPRELGPVPALGEHTESVRREFSALPPA